MKNAFFYFIIFPFLGFLNAIRNYRSSWAKPTIIAFVAFFGMSMVKSEAVDSSRYVQNLAEMYDSTKSFETIQNSFYNNSVEDGQVDIYVTLVTFVFSLFTTDGNLYFLFFGLVFGYFYANNIWLVLNESKGRLQWEQFLMIASFSLVIGFWSVNGVRMWTAAHVFFYGGFLYLYHNNKKGLFIAAASFLIHFSFVLPIALLLIYSVFRFNFRIVFFFYVATFFIAELNVGFIRTFLENNAPEFLLPKVKSYLNESYIEGVNETIIAANWYIIYFQKFISYFNLIFVSVLFFKSDIRKKQDKLFGFSLLFLSFANIISLLPSGGRFLNVAFLFSMAACFIILTQTRISFITKSAKMLSPLLIAFCVVSIRLSLDFFNITTLTNPIIVLLTNVNQPLIELLK